MDAAFAKKQKREVVKRQDVLYGEKFCTVTLTFHFLPFSVLIGCTWESGLRGDLRLHLRPQGSPPLPGREEVAREGFVRTHP